MTATATMQRKVRAYDNVAAAVQIPSKRVYICSPLRGDIERNITRAKLYCRFAFEKGFVPWCPHLYFAQFLDDTNKFERAACRRYGLEEMWRSKELWVFGSRISEGMRAEIELAEDLEIPVRYFDSNMDEVFYGSYL